ncbi:MAG: hypothetical protein IJC99_06750, partial [Clostridia bacterium]|nr:hypothetical protein [Clostridia bacterium]
SASNKGKPPHLSLQINKAVLISNYLLACVLVCVQFCQRGQVDLHAEDVIAVREVYMIHRVPRARLKTHIKMKPYKGFYLSIKQRKTAPLIFTDKQGGFDI